jgi:hypothetical protein
MFWEIREVKCVSIRYLHAAGVAFLGGFDDYCISHMRIYNRT